MRVKKAHFQNGPVPERPTLNTGTKQLVSHIYSLLHCFLYSYI